jgi:hypothetical protein
LSPNKRSFSCQRNVQNINPKYDSSFVYKAHALG